MRSAPLTNNEAQRLCVLQSYHVLDTPPEIAFDEIADLAAEICETPIALVTFVDEARQWFKVNLGLDIRETARSVSFCAHAILRDDLFTVPDTHMDARFADNPLVTGPPHIRFYAGSPLFSDNGCGLGTLCVLDRKPRTLSSVQRKALTVLRNHVLNVLELRRQNSELRLLNAELDSFNYACSHDLVAPTRRIASFCRILVDDYGSTLESEGNKLIERIEKSALDMRDLVEGMLALTKISRSVIAPTLVNLSELAAELVDELRSDDPERNVEVNVEPCLTALGDRRLLRIALANLLSNAWKFTANEKNARIDFGTEERKGTRYFFLRDNGVGFDGAYATDIFMPFRRLHPPDEFPGSGIGLTTTQRIVYRHGGDIFAESAPNEGATFFFKL